MGNSSIATKENTNILIDWDILRQEGLKYLQDMTGHIWTDYNVHDPGVTILETLCYAITDLESRLLLNIEDILANDPEQEVKKQFFSPAEILTINPVTINDYRKLLIDIDGVKNAWLEKEDDVEPNIYYDKDNNTLLYDYAKNSQKLKLNGLYRVFIEKDKNVADEIELRNKVKEKLHAHRNICEDFDEINIMQQETISIFTDIEIDEDVDANELMAKIYYDLEKFISPRIKQYSLKRMLQNGKNIEDIFNGPGLLNGFIDNEELEATEKKKELHTSDLIRIIMAHKEVKDVKKLFVSNKLNPDMTDKKEWALALDDTKAIVLEDFNSTKIRLFKNETLSPISANQVRSWIEQLKQQEKIDIYDDTVTDLSEQLGEYKNLTEYDSLTSKLPATYGISHAGLPSTVDDKRRAQAKQLKAYFLFFEQILMNYFKQLASFKDNISLKQNHKKILQTYFSEALPEELWKSDFEEVANQNAYEFLEDTDSGVQSDNAFKRRSRILNHLLAQFNEKFADYALFGYNVLSGLSVESKKPNFLKAKADFLENYPKLSRNRNRAYNLYSDNNDSKNVDGLKNLIAKKLGFDKHKGAQDDKHEFANFHILEHIHLRPTGSLALDFISSEKISEKYQPDPYSYRLTFILPRNIERFANRKFKELVYKTIEVETPAHISYNIVEFDPTQMSSFLYNYNELLKDIKIQKTTDTDQYNKNRNKLMEILSVGRVKLPVVHLNANYVNGEAGQQPANDSQIKTWKDLSKNENNAIGVEGSAPKYIKNDESNNAFLSFENEEQLKINTKIIENDFSIVVVYKTNVTASPDLQFNLISADKAGKENFGLFFEKTGGLITSLESEKIHSETTLNILHIATYTFEKDTRELKLYIDGQLCSTYKHDNEKISFNQKYILIGPDYSSTDDKAICEIGEVIILDSVLTGERKDKLEEYLSLQWGVVLSAISSIEIPALHLDANLGRSVIRKENETKILTWHDLSSKKIIATQDKKSMQPEYVVEAINKKSAISFDNTNLHFANSDENKLFSGDFTIAFVYKAKQSSGCLLDGTILEEDDQKKSFNFSIGEQAQVIVTAGDESIQISSTKNEAHLAIITGKVENSELILNIYIDGKSAHTISFADAQAFAKGPDNLMIGQSQNGENSFVGDMAEIIVYDEALSKKSRQRLEKFISVKWGIDISGINLVATPVAHLDASKVATVKFKNIGIGDKVVMWQDFGVFNNSAMQSNVSRWPDYSTDEINKLGAIHFANQPIDYSQITDEEYTDLYTVSNLKDIYHDSLVLEKRIQDDFTIMIVFKADNNYYFDKNYDPNPVTNPDYDKALDFHLQSDVTETTSWTAGAGLIDADCSGLYNDFGLSIGKRGTNLVVMGGIGDRLNEDHTIKTKDLEFDKTHFIVFSRKKSTGEVKLYVDGLLHAEADLRDNVVLNDSRNITIGDFNSEGLPFCGYIGEVIILDKVLDDDKRQQVEKYLSTKWGIALTSLPIDNAGLSLHFDALFTESFIKDDNNKISKWSDLSIVDKDVSAVQEQIEFQPQYIQECLNGMPAVRFNTNLITIDTKEVINKISGDFTFAIVYNVISTGNNHPDWEYGAGLIDNYHSEKQNNYGIAINKNNELSARISNSTINAVSANGPHVAIITRELNNGLINIYIDGKLASSANDVFSVVPFDNIEKLTIGAIQSADNISAGYFHGDISEIVMFNRLLFKDERQSLEKHLSMKWKIDISGLSSIGKPVLHLDASKLATIKINNQDTIFEWTDINQHNYPAVQVDKTKQPEYRENAYNNLGVINFQNSCLTIPRMVKDDFSVIVVYKADSVIGNYNYMPVPADAFNSIAYINNTKSIEIWNELSNTDNEYLDAGGNVLENFRPNEEGFSLNLKADLVDVKKNIETDIISIITKHSKNITPVSQENFTDIAGINNYISLEIWNGLNHKNFISRDGTVIPDLKLDLTVINNIKENTEVEILQILMTNSKVEKSTFTGIEDINALQSEQIWDELLEKELIFSNGNIDPEKIKSLNLNLVKDIEVEVIRSLITNLKNIEYVYDTSFTNIPGVDLPGSKDIWQKLFENGFLNKDGYVLIDLSLNLKTIEEFKHNTEVEILYILFNQVQVANDAFVGIASINQNRSEIIHSELTTKKILNADELVVFKFILNYEIDKDLNFKIFDIILTNKNDSTVIEEDAFVDITPEITIDRSKEIWHQLKEQEHIDKDGNVSEEFPLTNLFDINKITELAIIHVILKLNWFEGVGLLDGNVAGDMADMSKRDFGMLVSKEGKLMAGIGSLNDQDNMVDVGASFDKLHIGIFTRKKDTGIVKLYLDRQKPEQSKFARGLSLQDSNFFTIGAVNTGGNYFTGDIAEIIVFDKVLNEDQIDIVNSYLEKKWQVVPVLHLDAKNENSIVKDSENKISAWNDISGNNYHAQQINTSLQPIYTDGDYPAVTFDKKTLTLPNVANNDFTYVLVLKAENQAVEEFMPIKNNAFTSIFNITQLQSNIIWSQLVKSTMIDSSGNVLSNFTPGQAGFALGVSLSDFEAEICSIINSKNTIVAKSLFASIDSIDNNISNSIWNQLLSNDIIDEIGIINTSNFTPDQTDFTLNLTLIDFEDQIISILNNINENSGIVEANSFQSIESIDANLSGIIKTQLLGNGIIDNSGNLTGEYTPDETGFTLGLTLIDFEEEVITLLTAIRDNDGTIDSTLLTGIASDDQQLINTIWDKLVELKFIDNNDNILQNYNPNEIGFTLGLGINFLNNFNQLESAIINKLISNENRLVAKSLFASIPCITEQVSEFIWEELKSKSFISEVTDNEQIVWGKISAAFTPQMQDFTLNLNYGAIFNFAITNLLLAKNWYHGVGLIDGNVTGDINVAGTTAELNKKDFGILLGSSGQVIAGASETSNKVESGLLYDSNKHLVVITREKLTGKVNMIVGIDNDVENNIINNAIDKDFAAHLSFTDANTLTIGAVNTGGQYFKGEISELMIFDQVLIDTEIIRLQKYLKIKWGL